MPQSEIIPSLSLSLTVLNYLWSFLGDESHKLLKYTGFHSIKDEALSHSALIYVQSQVCCANTVKTNELSPCIALFIALRSASGCV